MSAELTLKITIPSLSILISLKLYQGILGILGILKFLKFPIFPFPEFPFLLLQSFCFTMSLLCYSATLALPLRYLRGIFRVFFTCPCAHYRCLQPLLRQSRLYLTLFTLLFLFMGCQCGTHSSNLKKKYPIN